ncbi:hypothetical protein MKW92_035038, partial [Papaver armeniacum]
YVRLIESEAQIFFRSSASVEACSISTGTAVMIRGVLAGSVDRLNPSLRSSEATIEILNLAPNKL